MFSVIIVALAALVGGILSALIGWLDSGEPFSRRKFGKSVIVSLLAALGFAMSYQIASRPVSLYDVFGAVLAGAGADAYVNRAWGATQQLRRSH